jgi:hypothetical protein
MVNMSTVKTKIRIKEDAKRDVALTDTGSHSDIYD